MGRGYVAVVAALCLVVASEVARLSRVVGLPFGGGGSLSPKDAARGELEAAGAALRFANASGDAAASASDPLVALNRERVRPRPRGVRIVLVGDSVTRYQYLSLAHFLRFGIWPDPRREPTPVYASTHRHDRHRSRYFEELHYQTNRLLYPNEICDCQRHAGFNQERRYYLDPARDNKVVFVNLQGDEPTDLGNTKNLRYFGSVKSPETLFADFARVLDGEFPAGRAFSRKREAAWQHDTWTDVLLHHVMRLDIGDEDQDASTAVFLNAGLHHHDLSPEDFRPLFSAATGSSPPLAMSNASSSPSNASSPPPDASSTAPSDPAPPDPGPPRHWRWFWKITTYTQQEVVTEEGEALASAGASANGTAAAAGAGAGGGEKAEVDRARIVEADRRLCSPEESPLECWDVSWTRRVCREHFYDAFHFREPVYRVLNEQMLDMLGLLPPGYERLDPRRVLW
jgi:hypothetical protein